MKKLLVMGCALFALVSGVFAEEWSAEKTQTTRAALQDGVFTLDIAKPTRYSIIQFRLDGKNMYADISTPLIIVEGRQENAED